MLSLLGAVLLAVGATGSLVGDLQELGKLRRANILNEDEFVAAKKRLIHEEGASEAGMSPIMDEGQIAELVSRVVLRHEKSMLEKMAAMIAQALNDQHPHSDRKGADLLAVSSAGAPIDRHGGGDGESGKRRRELQAGNNVASRVASANVWLQDAKSKVVFGPEADVCLQRDGDASLRIDGKLGISTPAPRSSTKEKVYVAGGEAFVDYAATPPARGGAVRLAANANEGFISFNNYFDAADGTVKHARTGGAGYVIGDISDHAGAGAGDLVFQTAPSGAAGSAASFTERVRIKEASTGLPVLNVKSGDGEHGLVHHGTNGVVQVGTYVGAHSAAVGTLTNHKLELRANGGPRMTLTTDGKVGVGTTSPAATLHAFSTGNTVAAALLLQHNSKGADRKVGLGFQLGASPVKAAIAFQSDNSPGTHGRGNVIFAVDSEDDAEGVTYEDEKMRISHNGNVGIGQKVPAFKLDVLGSTRLDGHADVTGNMAVHGQLAVDGKAAIGAGVDPSAALRVVEGTAGVTKLKIDDTNNNSNDYHIYAESNFGAANRAQFYTKSNGDAYAAGKLGVGMQPGTKDTSGARLEVHGPVAYGGKAGRHVLGWHTIDGYPRRSDGVLGPHWDIKTSLWAGGDQDGDGANDNIAYIFGGFSIRGFKYYGIDPVARDNGNTIDVQVYFYNSNGSVMAGNVLNVVSNGNWNPVSVYVSTDGYVCIRFTNIISSNYFGATIDLHSFFGMIPDITVTEESANDKEFNLYGTNTASENKGGSRAHAFTGGKVVMGPNKLGEENDSGAKLEVQGPIAYGDKGPRHVLGWHTIAGGESKKNWDIKTSLWGGGDGDGDGKDDNSDWIFGGFHVRGYMYGSGNTLFDVQLYFHNWASNGKPDFANLNVVSSGNWNPVTVYVSTDGYVCLRFSGISNGIYRTHYFGATIDLHQFFFGPARDIKVTEEAANDKEHNLYGNNQASDNKGGGATQSITNGLHIKGSSSDRAKTQSPLTIVSPKNTISMFLGEYTDDTNKYGKDDYSADIRFNGNNWAWGDLAYYPKGGDAGENGHFRFSTNGNVVGPTPDAVVGVGSLKATTSMCVGDTCVSESDLKNVKRFVWSTSVSGSYDLETIFDEARLNGGLRHGLHDCVLSSDNSAHWSAVRFTAAVNGYISEYSYIKHRYYNMHLVDGDTATGCGGRVLTMDGLAGWGAAIEHQAWPGTNAGMYYSAPAARNACAKMAGCHGVSLKFADGGTGGGTTGTYYLWATASYPSLRSYTNYRSWKYDSTFTGTRGPEFVQDGSFEFDRGSCLQTLKLTCTFLE